jgi:hypothetical protein
MALSSFWTPTSQCKIIFTPSPPIHQQAARQFFVAFASHLSSAFNTNSPQRFVVFPPQSSLAATFPSSGFVKIIDQAEKHFAKVARHLKSIHLLQHHVSAKK